MYKHGENKGSKKVLVDPVIFRRGSKVRAENRPPVLALFNLQKFFEINLILDKSRELAPSAPVSGRGDWF